MKVQKFVTYNSLDDNGKTVTDKYDLTLSVLEDSGNYLIHKDLLRHHTAQKQGTSSTKTRSEVRGGGRKPWQQKGSGRARAGSNRSPLWRGGGVIFGPKPKSTSLKLNKKEKQLALQTLLYNKRKSIWLIENLENVIDTPKTQKIFNILKKYNFNLTKKTLIVVSKKSMPFKLSIRNLKNVQLISVAHLNTLSLLSANQIILTLPAFNEIKEMYGN